MVDGSETITKHFEAIFTVKADGWAAGLNQVNSQSKQSVTVNNEVAKSVVNQHNQWRNSVYTMRILERGMGATNRGMKEIFGTNNELTKSFEKIMGVLNLIIGPIEILLAFYEMHVIMQKNLKRNVDATNVSLATQKVLMGPGGWAQLGVAGGKIGAGGFGGLRFQHGGEVQSPTLALLHGGERVVSKEENDRGSSGHTLIFQPGSINVADGTDFAIRIGKVIEEMDRLGINRSGYLKDRSGGV